MTQVEKLLKYQETDEKLLKIERELAGSEERKNYVQAKNFLTKAPEKLDALEAKAKELTTLLNEISKKYDEVAETLKDFDNLDELIDGGADIAFYKKNVSQILDSLKSIKGEVAALTKSIKDSEEEYQALKKKTITVQKQYAEYSEKYKKFRETKQGEAVSVQKELEKMAKEIDGAILGRYKEKRSERIFPIFCAVNNGRCSKCGTELSLAGKEKISSGAVTECENCHRILYNL